MVECKKVSESKSDWHMGDSVLTEELLKSALDNCVQGWETQCSRDIAVRTLNASLDCNDGTEFEPSQNFVSIKIPFSPQLSYVLTSQ